MMSWLFKIFLLFLWLLLTFDFISLCFLGTVLISVCFSWSSISVVAWSEISWWWVSILSIIMMVIEWVTSKVSFIMLRRISVVASVNGITSLGLTSLLLLLDVFNALISLEIIFVIDVLNDSDAIIITSISSYSWWFAGVLEFLMSILLSSRVDLRLFSFVRFSSMGISWLVIKVSKLKLMSPFVDSVPGILRVINWGLNFSDFLINLL